VNVVLSVERSMTKDVSLLALSVQFKEMAGRLLLPVEVADKFVGAASGDTDAVAVLLYAELPFSFVAFTR